MANETCLLMAFISLGTAYAGGEGMQTMEQCHLHFGVQ